MTGFPIRPGMDVYSAYQNQYIGSVVEVVEVVEGEGSASTGAAPEKTGSSAGAVEGNPELVHEEGAAVSPTRFVAERRLGEEMGPVPTVGLGNTGPVEQSAAQHYATEPGHPARNVIRFAVRPGRINLGILTPPIWVPVDAIRSISMERIVLDVQKEAIPRAWRQRPE